MVSFHQVGEFVEEQLISRRWTGAVNNDNIGAWSLNVNCQHFHWTIMRHSQRTNNVTRLMKRTITTMIRQQVRLFLGWSLVSSFRASITRWSARDDIRTIHWIVHVSTMANMSNLPDVIQSTICVFLPIDLALSTLQWIVWENDSRCIETSIRCDVRKRTRCMGGRFPTTVGKRCCW